MGTLSNTTAEKAVLGAAATQRRRKSLNRQLVFWLLVGPALALFAVMMLWPLLNMFYVSTLDWRGLVKPSTFSGLDNYARLLGRSQFYTALYNTTVHIAIALPGTIIPACLRTSSNLATTAGSPATKPNR